jgi:hypothetical protein
MKFKLGAMTFGEILDRGLKILFARLPAFLILGAILLLPMFIVQILQPQIVSGVGAAAGIVMVLFFMIFSFIYAGAVVDVISREYHGKTVSIGGAISFALRRFGPLLGTALLTGLVIGLGLLLLIIPGIIFSIWFAFVTQVVMVEGLSGTSAMSRSKELTKGHGGRIFGILFIIGLLNGLINVGLTMGLASALPVQQIVVGRGGLEYGPVNMTNLVILSFIEYVISIFTSSFQSICVTLMYFDLRVRKEGYDLEVLASQTDEA